ncbi:MAG: hypothetical protein Q9157_003226 [Trypethelium eluteriae]
MTTETSEFSINPKIGVGLVTFIYDQLFVTPKYPTQSVAGETIIVTGANVGLGLETARHFYRLGCARMVLAVRTISKGQKAKENIVESIKQRKDADAVEVWQLDLDSTDSTLGFVRRVNAELPRVDKVVENAGINSRTWATAEGFERNIQVNVVNTCLVAMALLPKMTQTKERYPDSLPTLTIVSSGAHRLTKFEEVNASDIYAQLNDEKSYKGGERYQITKLLEILVVREVVSRHSVANSGAPPVIINLANPGLCTSELDRGVKSGAIVSFLRRWFERTTEVGARTLVLAACAGFNSNGESVVDGKIESVESWIYTDMGQRVQKKVFDQTLRILENRKPGIGAEAGL